MHRLHFLTCSSQWHYYLQKVFMYCYHAHCYHKHKKSAHANLPPMQVYILWFSKFGPNKNSILLFILKIVLSCYLSLHYNSNFPFFKILVCYVQHTLNAVPYLHMKSNKLKHYTNCLNNGIHEKEWHHVSILDKTSRRFWSWLETELQKCDRFLSGSAPHWLVFHPLQSSGKQEVWIKVLFE